MTILHRFLTSIFLASQAVKLFEEAVSAGVFTSIYQRAGSLTAGLRAEPVWTDLDLAVLEFTQQEREEVVQAVIFKGNYTFVHHYLFCVICIVHSNHVSRVGFRYMLMTTSNQNSLNWRR